MDDLAAATGAAMAAAAAARRGRTAAVLLQLVLSLGLVLRLDFAFGELGAGFGERDATFGELVARDGHAARAPYERGVELVDVARVLERAGQVGALDPAVRLRARRRLASASASTAAPGRRWARRRRRQAVGQPRRRRVRGAALHVYGHEPRQRSRANGSPCGWCACDTNGSTCAG